MARLTSAARSSLSCAIGTGTLAYFLLAVPGYATFGALVQDDVLKSYPTDSKLVAVARIGISLIVTLCYPLQAHPTRMCVTSIYLTLAAHAERLCGRRQRRGLLLGGLDAPLAHEPSSALTTQMQADLGGTPQEQRGGRRGRPRHSVGASTTSLVIATAFIAIDAIALKVTGSASSSRSSARPAPQPSRPSSRGVLSIASKRAVLSTAPAVFVLTMLVSGLVSAASPTFIILKQMWEMMAHPGRGRRRARAGVARQRIRHFFGSVIYI